MSAGPSTITPSAAEQAILAADSRKFLGHPMGLFLLFFVEMWERFSYYGMRGILVLYLTSPTGGMRNPAPSAPKGFNPGPGWEDSVANTAYGWYTGLAYLTPIVGGMIADKLIGTHRSMIMGGLLIALGHIVLGVSGLDSAASSGMGMTIFVLGLSLIVIGTGHFKPSVSVMVGQLYRHGDPRRETAFGIFYMGINLGSALQTYIVGTLGERVGWHWGFGAAAVGMLLGLSVYVIFRGRLLAGIGEPPSKEKARVAPALLPIGIVLSCLIAWAFSNDLLSKFDTFVSKTWVTATLGGLAAAWAIWFSLKQRPEDRGPVASIFIFMLFNAVFWLSFEQAGSSINIFTDRFTDRSVTVAGWWTTFATTQSIAVGSIIAVVGLALAGFAASRCVINNSEKRYTKATLSLVLTLVSLLVVVVGVLKALGQFGFAAELNPIPTTWFQSVNPWLIVVFAPITGVMWTALTRRNANPSQPYKISFGLVLVGLGYLFMVWAALQAHEPAKAQMWLICATYFVHTMGEIVLSPTGLSYVTKAAPREYTSLLMGVWFISSFMANLGAGKVAAMVEPILEGKSSLPWHLDKAAVAVEAGGKVANTQADFFFLFVITSCGAGLLILVLGPLLKKLTGGRDS